MLGVATVPEAMETQGSRNKKTEYFFWEVLIPGKAGVVVENTLTPACYSLDVLEFSFRSRC